MGMRNGATKPPSRPSELTDLACVTTIRLAGGVHAYANVFQLDQLHNVITGHAAYNN
jgi:hypothetical protein